MVWLVKMRAVRRKGDSVWSPEFVVQAEPNEWETAVRRSSAAAFANLDKFYEQCAAELGRSGPRRRGPSSRTGCRGASLRAHTAKNAIALDALPLTAREPSTGRLENRALRA